ncbi:hypothetical protein KQI41_00425 [Tissierella pigra]|uniref:Uncharacterized protein n=1 Tax=Tissierella pigra TaxID=2607614 RepID=A0A6N7XUT7_9FIRM|nr:hypothetical protein [Tissierella pigra]MBU5424857.1 hypothetical protein [Tissierella pigra]MSU01203.1 hypothetical protein [Tissierella pigra]
MYRGINEEIYELKERLRTKEKLDSFRIMTMEELNKQKQNLQNLRDILKKEEKDVTKLESMSLSTFFFDLIGKKEDKLDKERKEYLAVKMQYDECILAIRELEDEIKKCDKELMNYSSVKKEYEEAIKKKQEMIINEDGDKGRTLRDLLDKQNELKLNIKEVKEAINAGKNASGALSQMMEPLDSARNWGIWDMLGGGFFTDMVKHSKIDDANKMSYDVQQCLKRFQKELNDVNEFTDITVDIGSFATFADFFFDGLFADWFVQSKINESISNLDNANTKVGDIIEDLNRDLTIMESQQESIETKINKLLER